MPLNQESGGAIARGRTGILRYLRSCRSKVVGLSVGVAALCCFAVAHQTAAHHRSILERDTRRVLVAVADQAAADLARQFSHLEDEAVDLAQGTDLVRRWRSLSALEAGGDARREAEAELRALLRRFARRHAPIAEVRIDDAATGRVRFSTLEHGEEGALLAPTDLRDLEHGEVFSTEVFPAVVVLPRPDGAGSRGAPSVFLATPIGGPDAEDILTVRIDTRGMNDTLVRDRTLALEEEMESLDVYVLDWTGRLLSRVAFAEDLRRQGLFGTRPGDEVILRVAGTEDLVLPLRRCLQAGGAEAPSVPFEMEPYPDYRGVPVVGAWRAVEGRDWFVVAEIDHAEMVRPLVDSRRAALVLSVLLCAIVAVIVAATSRTMTSPLARLQEVAGRLENGDFGARCDLNRADEFGDLARAFDRTASALVARSEALEAEVEERMEVEARLRESEARTASILSLAPEGVITIDDRGRITGWNQRAEAIFGWFEPEMLGEPIVPTVIPPGHWVARILSGEQGLERRMGRESPREIELELTRRDGRHIPTELRIIPFSDGHADAFCVFLRDITDRKWAAEQMRAQHRQLEEHNAELLETRTRLQASVRDLALVNAELDSFAHIASHDLQEPARSLVSFSSLLVEDLGTDLPEEAAKDLEFITRAATRMKKLVQDLLALSRTGRVELNVEEVDLNECLDEVIRSLHLRIEETGARIRRGPLLTIEGDRTVLTQVLQNLVSNALKFNRDAPLVEVAAFEDDDHWEVGVRDNGIGIDAKQHERIFKPFRRLHGTTEYEGSGIGLAVCQKGVALHGGRVWVESSLGNGAHFKFVIPRRASRKDKPCTVGQEGHVKP